MEIVQWQNETKPCKSHDRAPLNLSKGNGEYNGTLRMESLDGKPCRSKRMCARERERETKKNIQRNRAKEWQRKRKRETQDERDVNVDKKKLRFIGCRYTHQTTAVQFVPGQCRSVCSLRRTSKSSTKQKRTNQTDTNHKPATQQYQQQQRNLIELAKKRWKTVHTLFLAKHHWGEIGGTPFLKECLSTMM